MIIVMDNLNAVKPGESAAIFGARGLVHRQVPRLQRQRRLRPRDPVAVRRRPLDEEVAGSAVPPTAR